MKYTMALWGIREQMDIYHQLAHTLRETRGLTVESQY
jgi:hypothetical protein